MLWRIPVLCLILAVLCGPTLAEERRLLLLHTNDIHGHLRAEPDRGLSRVASVIRAKRREFPGQVVLLDGGDTSLGTPLSGLFLGRPMALAFSSLKYDAVTLGNHEFNWGKDAMRDLTQGMESSVLCANLVNENRPGAPYPGWTVIERNGCRLGVFGLVTPDTPRRAPKPATEGWRFLEPADGARLALQEMPPVDAVIALTHIGVDRDRELARAVPGLDLIVGGHSHTALREVVRESGVPIVQAGCYAQYLGSLEVVIDTERNTLEVVDYDLIPIDDEIEPDPELATIAETFAEQVDPLLDKVVARVSQVVSKTPSGDNYDTPLGNLMSDILRASMGTDVAFYNRGGVRTDMPAGALKVRDIHRLFPFNDPIVVMSMTGRDLILVVKQGTVDGEGPLSASGLTAVVNDRTGQVEKLLVGGEPVDLDATYTVATTQFLSQGGDGMSEFTLHESVSSADFPRDLLQRWAESHPVLTPPAEGRLRQASEADD